MDALGPGNGLFYKWNSVYTRHTAVAPMLEIDSNAFSSVGQLTIQVQKFACKTYTQIVQLIVLL